MKPPLKPFTVEVKRSRSSSPAARPVLTEPLVLTEIKSEPAPASQARRLAEQMFTSLTSAPSVERETAESVFRPVAPRTATVKELVLEPATTVPEVQALPVEAVVPAKTEAIAPARTRKPRAAMDATSAAPAKRVGRPKASEAGVAVAGSAPARPRQDPASEVPALSVPVVVMDEDASPSLASEAELQDRQNWGWGPGERWKRRLRHLR